MRSTAFKGVLIGASLFKLFLKVLILTAQLLEEFSVGPALLRPGRTKAVPGLQAQSASRREAGTSYNLVVFLPLQNYCTAFKDGVTAGLKCWAKTFPHLKHSTEWHPVPFFLFYEYRTLFFLSILFLPPPFSLRVQP